MDDVLEFAQEISSRSAYKKFVRKVDDATTVKSLDMRLTHAFQLFEVRISSTLFTFYGITLTLDRSNRV